VTTFDPLDYFSTLGDLPEDDIDPLRAALSLSADDHPGLSWGRYLFHAEQMTKDVTAAFESARAHGRPDSAATRLSALTSILADREDYAGDTDAYDHLDNADMVRVIDRRRGLPVSVALVYLSVTRALGWDAAGLAFPAHVLCRLQHGGERVIFDPFHRGQALSAPDLRALTKRLMGADTELSASWFEPVGTRDLLVRLLNNIKLRQVKAEDYAAALATVEKMRRVAPGEYRALFDAGVLYARVGQKARAVAMLEDYIARCPKAADRADAARLIREIQAALQ
jgi:regulator of sirC expression with transglutaminase-like and TPR domain